MPLYEFQSHRTKLLDYYDRKENNQRAGADDKGLKAYWAEKNLKSIDGLDALSYAHTCDVIPRSVFNEKEEGKKAIRGSAVTEKRWNAGDLKFLVGLSIGILISALYVRLGAIV